MKCYIVSWNEYEEPAFDDVLGPFDSLEAARRTAHNDYATIFTYDTLGNRHELESGEYDPDDDEMKWKKLADAPEEMQLFCWTIYETWGYYRMVLAARSVEEARELAYTSGQVSYYMLQVISVNEPEKYTTPQIVGYITHNYF